MKNARRRVRKSRALAAVHAATRGKDGELFKRGYAGGVYRYDAAQEAKRNRRMRRSDKKAGSKGVVTHGALSALAPTSGGRNQQQRGMLGKEYRAVKRMLGPAKRKGLPGRKGRKAPSPRRMR